MGKDYYLILSIPRTSTPAEIKKAYHRKALEYHPDKNPLSGAVFTEVAEAYDVLSSDCKKAIFDKHGEDGLKNRCQYKFNEDPVELFRDIFFAAQELHYKHRSKRTQRVYTKRCSRHPPLLKEKDKAIVKDLNMTLEELYTGLTKRIKITKKIQSTSNPHKFKEEEKILEIRIRPGWKDGTRITFEREGNIMQDSVPGDIVFIVREKQHSDFQRSGDDLVHNVTISLKHSLIGRHLTVPTIENNITLDVRIEDIIYPGFTKVLPHHGMHSQKDFNIRGNLILKFTIKFPESLSPEAIEILSRILPD